jgi:hypothetical protein
MNAPLIFPLANLADAFAEHLFADELRDRMAHHLAHMASERWLAMELAYSVNKSETESREWAAVLERKRIDVTLVLVGNGLQTNSADQPIYIECKMAGPRYWYVWDEIKLDLTGKTYANSKSVKPRADYAVCFLYDYAPHMFPKQPTAKLELSRMCMASIPEDPGPFTPYSHTHKFVLLHSSRVHGLEWPKPIPGIWEHGFAISMRILWLANPLENSSDDE